MTSNDFNKYGVPAQKKFPMPDADHVRSAIKFFNYVSPQYEKILARAILQRAKEYGVDLSEMSISDENRFKKYLPESELKHHGIKGQKWGVRRFQNEDGTLTKAGKERYGKREEFIKKREGDIKSTNKSIKSDSKYLSKLEKEGINGSTFKSQLESWWDPDEKKRHFYNTRGNPDDVFYTKKEAYDALKEYTKYGIESNNDRIRKFRNEIETVKNTPITEKSFVDNIDAGKKATLATTAALSLTSYGAFIGTGHFLLGTYLLAPIVVGSAVAGVKVGDKVENLGVKKKYRRNSSYFDRDKW